MEEQVIFGTFDGLKVYVDASSFRKYVVDEGKEVILGEIYDFYCYEHYPYGDRGEYVAVKTHLTNKIDELEKIIAGFQNWNYRCWHGEMEYIMQEREKLQETVREYKKGMKERG